MAECLKTSHEKVDRGKKARNDSLQGGRNVSNGNNDMGYPGGEYDLGGYNFPSSRSWPIFATRKVTGV